MDPGRAFRVWDLGFGFGNVGCSLWVEVVGFLALGFAGNPRVGELMSGAGQAQVAEPSTSASSIKETGLRQSFNIVECTIKQSNIIQYNII